MSSESQPVFTTRGKNSNEVRRQQILVHVGQSGIQIGRSLWELVAFEQGIAKDGTLIPDKEHHNLNTLFSEVYDSANGDKEYYFPRTVFLDLEPTCIADIMQFEWKNFYEPSRMISTYHDSSGNLARARGAMGNELINRGCDQLRIVIEGCDLPQNAIAVRGATGGCGGGITPEICEFLTSHLRAVHVHEIVPSPFSPSIPVESYNYILAVDLVVPFCDTITKYDNHHLLKMLDIVTGVEAEPTLNCLNHLVIHPISCFTSGRFRSSGSPCSATEMKTNLQVFPSLKHITPGYAPISDKGSIEHNHTFTPEYLLTAVMEEECTFIDMDFSGKIISMAVTFRGTFDFRKVFDAVSKLTEPRHELGQRFVQWNRPIKLSMITTPATFPKNFMPPDEPRVVYKFSNETGIKTHYMDWLDRYCQLLNRGAFHSSYLKEGMELSEFQEAFENVKQICSDYEAAIEGNLAEDADADNAE